jgi:hypothetical protein
MTIKIAIPSTKITPGQIEDIIFHFNHMKSKHIGTLESLQKPEGGFAIIPLLPANTTKKHIYETTKNPFMEKLEHEQRIPREFRWNQQKYLVSYCNIPSFSKEEEMLLFDVMCFVLGKQNVKYYETYGDAKEESPSIVENMLQTKYFKRMMSAYSPPQQTSFMKLFPSSF